MSPRQSRRNNIEFYMPLQTLKKRSQFLRVRGGARKATRGFVLEGKPHPRNQQPAKSPAASQAGEQVEQPPTPAQFGFTVTKKMGNAVTRNLIRRRLKSATAEIADKLGRNDCDYVIVARRPALAMPFAELQKDLVEALSSVNRRLEKPRQRRRSSSRHGG